MAGYVAESLPNLFGDPTLDPDVYDPDRPDDETARLLRQHLPQTGEEG